MNMPYRKFPSALLLAWVKNAFTAVGMPGSDACSAAEMLVQTSLWGIDSHGIARVPHYLERFSTESIRTNPLIEFHQTGMATGDLDGGHGLGLLICRRAMLESVNLARKAGVGIVGVRNSSHCGAIGLYSRQASEVGMIGMAFTHSDSFVVPHLGATAFFGTNPISISIPTSDVERPLCLDMATSCTTWNRIMNARRENVSVPEGLGVTSDGNDTTNPNEIVALKPMADHKGYAMAFLIDMLCGPLNGMAFGPGLTKMYSEMDKHRRLGSLMIAIDPLRFAGGASLPKMVEEAISSVLARGAHIRYPGQPEYLSAEQRGLTGIPVEPGLLKDILAWSSRLGISCPAEVSE